METSAMMGGDFSDENIKEICQILLTAIFIQRFRNAHKISWGLLSYVSRRRSTEIARLAAQQINL